MKVTVITGDHTRPDAEKATGKYNQEDFKAHDKMVAAFKEIPKLSVSIINDHADLMSQLMQQQPDLVINFCDTGYFNQIQLELHVPALLELLNIHYSGASPATIAMTYDKAIVRLAAQALGIAVPNEMFLAKDEKLNPNLSFPALIKPNCADGSLGITKDAVVRNLVEANGYIDWLRKTLPGRDILIQEYLAGKEYSVGLIGNPGAYLEMLPILEVDFSHLPPGYNPILSYESKAVPESPYWTDIKYIPAELAADEKQQLEEWAKKLFSRFKFRDYGRFDFRRDRHGVIKLMEVNPNPAWGYDGKLALMASFGQTSYADFLHKLLTATQRRLGLI